MYIPKPTVPVPIKPARYDATLDAATGKLKITRNDESGKLTTEDLKRMGIYR